MTPGQTCDLFTIAGEANGAGVDDGKKLGREIRRDAATRG